LFRTPKIKLHLSSNIPVVHTSGINWNAVGAIGGIVTALLAVMLTFIIWRQNQQKHEITTAISSLEAVLIEKLETKENVNQIRVDMAKLSQTVEFLMKGNP